MHTTCSTSGTLAVAAAVFWGLALLFFGLAHVRAVLRDRRAGRAFRKARGQ